MNFARYRRSEPRCSGQVEGEVAAMLAREDHGPMTGIAGRWVFCQAMAVPIFWATARDGRANIRHAASYMDVAFAGPFAICRQDTEASF